MAVSRTQEGLLGPAPPIPLTPSDSPPPHLRSMLVEAASAEAQMLAVGGGAVSSALQADDHVGCLLLSRPGCRKVEEPAL